MQSCSFAELFEQLMDMRRLYRL